MSYANSGGLGNRLSLISVGALPSLELFRDLENSNHVNVYKLTDALRLSLKEL